MKTVANGKRALLTILLGGVVLAGYLLHVWQYRTQINDDAYITFRYSLFLAAGHGPYYNIGEHVEGYTNFLLMVLLAGIIKITGVAAAPDVVPIAAKVIGALGGVLTIVATWGLCARWLRAIPGLRRWASLLAWLAPALIVPNTAFAMHSVTGLETALFSGWLLLALWLWQQSADARRWRGAGIVFALAALTRPEGALAFAAAWLGSLLAGVWRRPSARRVLIIDTAIVVLVIGAHLAFRYVAYDGEWLPNTYYAKSDDRLWHAASSAYIRGFAAEHLGGLAGLALLLPLLARRGRSRRAATPALLVIAAAVVGLFKTGPGWMIGYRLLVPYAPLWAALAVCGVAAVADRLPRYLVPGTLLGGVLLLLIVGARGDVRQSYRQQCLAAVHGYQTGHIALANWLHETAHPGDTVALMDIGLVGFRCADLRIQDITGLTDRHIAKSPGGLFEKDYDPDYILAQRPQFIVIVISGFEEPDGELSFMALTPIGQRLANNRRFIDAYNRPPPPWPPADPLDRLAAAFGAARVFDHADPKMTYWLAAFTRKPNAPDAPNRPHAPSLVMPPRDAGS